MVYVALLLSLYTYLHKTSYKDSPWAENVMCPFAFGIQCSRSQCIDYWKWFMLHYCFPFTPIIIKLYINTPHELRICPINFGVIRSKVKVTMPWFLKMVFVHNCFPFTANIIKHNKTCTLNCRCALLISGSKGQRPRSQCIDSWKWFMSDNCFPFTPEEPYWS